jgi:hypothetical protein
MTVAFKGATAYEIQIGRVWARLLRPKVWCRRNLRYLITVGIQDKESYDLCRSDEYES